jgi:hypothetical protein
MTNLAEQTLNSLNAELTSMSQLGDNLAIDNPVV